MEIRANDLRANRANVVAGQVDMHHDLKRRIYQSWKVYSESHDAKKASEAYGHWCRLVDELDEVEPLE